MSGRYNVQTTFKAVGGKYTDFGGLDGKRYDLVDGGVHLWTGHAVVRTIDLGPGNVVSRGMTPVRTIGDYGVAFDGKRVYVEMMPGMSHRLQFGCPAVDASVGASVTTQH